MAGQATAYNTSKFYAAISFQKHARNFTAIDGSLGAIFGTLADGSQPGFVNTFFAAYFLTHVPETLFSGIYGAPKEWMFYGTFYGCEGLTSIPENLFADIYGAPANGVFLMTFYACAGLTSIPDGLFAGISGAPASNMFNRTFSECTGLTSIPENLFRGISGPAQSDMFYQTFYYCTSLTGPSARINGQYLYEIWPDVTTEQVEEMYYGASKLSDYLHIPVAWGGLGATTNEYPSAPSDAVYDFYLTTTSDTDVFAMQISAAGEFYIDWGDGKSEWVTKSDTTNMGFGHKYASKGAYNIKLGGQATAYNTSSTTAAISFYIGAINAKKIASIDGSLGAIFETLANGTQPRFYQTFYNATNMTGSIPDGLFAGISGAPASYMFYGTFYNCSGLTSIPDDLFAGISGAPASYMFYETFRACSGLTSIPAGLFGNLSGAPASNMFAYTFYGCNGLTGAIPDGLFGNLTGAPASNMFTYTFYNCNKLTSIPENLFGNISGAAQNRMFYYTFSYCTSLTGPSARINGQYLYEIWPDATTSQVGGMYYNATKLDDYSNIPSRWK